MSCYFVTAISSGGERAFKLTTIWKILQYLFGNRSQKNRKNLEGKLISEAYSEPSRTSKMKLFAKIDHGFQPLTIFLKSSILDVPLDSEYASEYHAILNIIFLLIHGTIASLHFFILSWHKIVKFWQKTRKVLKINKMNVFMHF